MSGCSSLRTKLIGVFLGDDVIEDVDKRGADDAVDDEKMMSIVLTSYTKTKLGIMHRGRRRNRRRRISDDEVDGRLLLKCEGG